MKNPEYHLHKTNDAIKRNIVNIFPLIDQDFKIHVINIDGKDDVIERLDEVFAKSLCSIITLGDEFKNLAKKVKIPYPDKKEILIDVRESHCIPLQMKNTQGEMKSYNLIVKGWIGAYESTKGRKRDISDFPDNFISLYAHKKMGEFNILPKVGKNSLIESFIVGQLYVDLFELSELPDMALSNRQGYKSDDLRYEAVINYVRKILLPAIINKRSTYAALKNAAAQKKQLNEQKKKEETLKRAVDNFRRKAGNTIYDTIKENKNYTSEQVHKVVEKAINDNIPDFGLKKIVDSAKKKLLISQTGADKDLSDLVYNFLLFNGVPAKEIIYSNCDESVSRIPSDVSIYDYLRDFFVNSYSDQKIHVVFITSQHITCSFGTMSEIGAAWITKADHRIINVDGFRPQKPLDDGVVWQTTMIDEDGNISMTKLNADLFCEEIESLCTKLGYTPKDRKTNMTKLGNTIKIVK